MTGAELSRDPGQCFPRHSDRAGSQVEQPGLRLSPYGMLVLQVADRYAVLLLQPLVKFFSCGLTTFNEKKKAKIRYFINFKLKVMTTRQ